MAKVVILPKLYTDNLRIITTLEMATVQVQFAKLAQFDLISTNIRHSLFSIIILIITEAIP